MSDLRNKLIDYLMVHGDVPLTIQEKPYTVVRMTFIVQPDKLFVEHGFAKVKYPDKWDEEFGFNLACWKAAAKIAKKIIKEPELVNLLLENNEPVQIS